MRKPRKNEPQPTAAHVQVASQLLRLIAVLGALLGAILLIGGLYLAFDGALAATKFNLFGNEFSSTSVGVSMAFIGAVLVVTTFRRVLRSLDRFPPLPDDGGSGPDSLVSWPEEKSLESLKRKLDRISQTNAKILKAVAGADQYGIYVGVLSRSTGIPREELVYRGKELQNDGLIEIIGLTDVNFRLQRDITTVLGANATQFITAYFR